MYGKIITIVLLQFVAFEAISALKCYNCSSLIDERCGTTFNFDKDSNATNALLVDCPGEYSACKKMENKDTHKAITIVERSCWNYNNNGTVKSEFYACNDHSFGEVCYCRDDGDKPCNNQIRVTPTLATLLLGLLPFSLFL